MQKVCRAVIDVGTNSVKLLVAEVAGQIVTPLLEQSEQTRLGRGFYPMHRLQADAILQTARAVAGFAEVAAKFRPVSTRVIATSAARDAVNQAELLDAIHRVASLPVEVITGEEEANWVYRGVTSNAALAERPLLILDVGGGSTEFILGEGATQYYQHSFPLGTVRLLEQLEVSDPPTATELTRCMNLTRDAPGPKKPSPSIPGSRTPMPCWVTPPSSWATTIRLLIITRTHWTSGRTCLPTAARRIWFG
jgi:exopolyphosphatase/guanosine-5'-triphosphate,3'-diphosphate pyrophosphatase